MECTHPFGVLLSAEAGDLGVGICRNYFNTHPSGAFGAAEAAFFHKLILLGGGFQEVFYGAAKGSCKLVEGLALGFVNVVLALLIHLD